LGSKFKQKSLIKNLLIKKLASIHMLLSTNVVKIWFCGRLPIRIALNPHPHKCAFAENRMISGATMAQHCFLYPHSMRVGCPQMVRKFGFVALDSASLWVNKTKFFHLWCPFLWLLSFGHAKESNKGAWG
jgi:hypothetical protein